MAEASAQKGTSGGEDTSMEEILQSIRSIIAEDGDGGKTGGEKKDPNNPAGEVAGSDVLELTDSMAAEAAAAPAATPPAAPVIEAPAAAPAAPAAAPAAPAAAPAAPAPAASADVLSQIENALATPAAAPAPAAAAPTGETLLSPEAAALATNAVKKLQAAVEPPIPANTTTPSPSFMSGNTVEAMAAAMLRPMIKEWLDKNLPGIVERIVTMEIRRLSK